MANTTADRLNRLAFKLADEYAEIAFRSSCPGYEGWYAIPSATDRDGHLNQVLRYLRARRMLERNPNNSEQWRTVAAPKRIRAAGA